jgi:Ni/Fe-hydrogenase subunit HybB-like protein
VLPIIFLIFPKGRKPLPLFIIAVVVVVTSWWKRYLIVVPALLHPFLPIQGVPESWHSYFPSMHEWAIVSATLAAALLIVTILVRYLPIIPIHRTAAEMGILDKENPAQP